MDNFKNVTAQDIVCSQVLIQPVLSVSVFCCFTAKHCLTNNSILLISQKSGVTLKEEDVAVCNVRIDLTRGRHSPLERYLRMSFSKLLFYILVQPLLSIK